MADDKLNLVLASAMIRSLAAKTSVFEIPGVFNAGRLELIEQAAGLKVRGDGNCVCARVGENLQDGDSAFVKIENAPRYVDAFAIAAAQAVAQLYENLIAKGPPPPEYKLMCRACAWLSVGQVVKSFVEAVTVPKSSGSGYVRIPCIVCPVCHSDAVMLTWGDPFVWHEAKK